MTEDHPSSAASDGSWPNLRAQGIVAMYQALGQAMTETEAAEVDLRDGKIGEELVDIGFVSVWGALWARDGLSPRDRSLVTLGALIALGAETEVGHHVRIGLNNGLTEEEIAEVIYHVGGYAGFPAAMKARKAARDTLGQT